MYFFLYTCETLLYLLSLNKYTTTNTMIKTKKITAGYYQGRYNYIDFTIQKVCDLPNSEVAWYWQIGNKKVHDWYKSKSQAVEAVKQYIDGIL